MATSDSGSPSNGRSYELVSGQLTIDIPEGLESTSQLSPYIFKVPEKLKKDKTNEYCPQLISIGPLHYGNDKLAAMDKHKIRYLLDYCKEAGMTFDELVTFVKEHEDFSAFVNSIKWHRDILAKFRRSDDGAEAEAEVDHDRVIKMILLDSAFIIELFLKEKERQKEEAAADQEQEKEKHISDYLVDTPWFRNAIKQDLLLLENQLPFFFLKKLYEKRFESSKNIEAFDTLACSHYFSKFKDPPQRKKRRCKKCCTSDCCWSCLYCMWMTKFCSSPHGNNDSVKQKETEQMPEFQHFIDLLRWYRSRRHPSSEGGGIFRCLFNATKLNEAGVILERDDGLWPLGITFNNGVLKMARLEIDDTTECLLRNLMAWEQLKYPNEAYICDYITFLDLIIDTEDDVALFVEKDIIGNWLGSNEAVKQLVNGLGRHITITNSCYGGILKDLNNHYEHWYYRKVAVLRHVYFSNIWKGSGTVVAFVLLILTAIQSVRSLMKRF